MRKPFTPIAVLLPLLSVVFVGGCGALRGIEQWKCDNWGMCHFGVTPSVSHGDIPHGDIPHGAVVTEEAYPGGAPHDPSGAVLLHPLPSPPPKRAFTAPKRVFTGRPTRTARPVTSNSTLPPPTHGPDRPPLRSSA